MMLKCWALPHANSICSKCRFTRSILSVHWKSSSTVRSFKPIQVLSWLRPVKETHIRRIKTTQKASNYVFFSLFVDNQNTCKCGQNCKKMTGKVAKQQFLATELENGETVTPMLSNLVKMCWLLLICMLRWWRWGGRSWFKSQILQSCCNYSVLTQRWCNFQQRNYKLRVQPHVEHPPPPPINHIPLPNDTHPLSAGMETSMFKSIKQTFWQLWGEERWLPFWWSAPINTRETMRRR